MSECGSNIVQYVHFIVLAKYVADQTKPINGICEGVTPTTEKFVCDLLPFVSCLIIFCLNELNNETKMCCFRMKCTSQLEKVLSVSVFHMGLVVQQNLSLAFPTY